MEAKRMKKRREEKKRKEKKRQDKTQKITLKISFLDFELSSNFGTFFPGTEYKFPQRKS